MSTGEDTTVIGPMVNSHGLDAKALGHGHEGIGIHGENRHIISKSNWIDGIKMHLLTSHCCSANTGAKAAPVLCADIIGDRRDEMILRTIINLDLSNFTTPVPSANP